MCLPQSWIAVAALPHALDADESYYIQDHIQPSFADSWFATHCAIITAHAIYKFVWKICAYPNTLHLLLQKKYQILGQDVWGQFRAGSCSLQWNQSSLEHLPLAVAQLVNDKCASLSFPFWDGTILVCHGICEPPWAQYCRFWQLIILVWGLPHEEVYPW